MDRRRYRIGEYEFDAETGELTPLSGGTGAAATRLAPQPARLLALLAEAGGDVVPREAIREAVWPDVEVDFDAGLHFCIRQIRSALGDTAQQPRYIETLPRRGYRLIPAVTTPDAGEGEPAVAAWPLDRWVAAAVLLLIAASAIFVAFRVADSPVDAAPQREPGAPGIAVMPFVPPASWGEPDPRIAAIAEGLLEILAAPGVERLRVVGPSTTVAHDPDRGLVALANAHELDWVVNGRFIRDETGPHVLAELIRASDGAHVWVQRYRQFDDSDAIAAEIGREVLARVR